MPLNQIDPPNKISLITGDPYYFVNKVKYCHNYPDLVCYDRSQNGQTGGDQYALTVTSCTDSSGLGSVRVLFPKRRDSENSHDVNGLYHPDNFDRVLGSHVILTSFNGYVRFHPGATIDFYAFVPFQRFPGGLYVEFSGPPSTCLVFVFIRRIVWIGDPPPYVPPENQDRHDEL